MKIARFGDTYATAHSFGDALMEDSYKSSRPPIAQRVSGGSGAFDFYGDDHFPLEPVVLRKKYTLTAATSAAIDNALDTLRLHTIGSPGEFATRALGDKSKLWFLDRDGSTTYWAWAKCIGLDVAESYRERGHWAKNVNLDFSCPEGVRYGATQDSGTSTTDSLNWFIHKDYTGDYPGAFKVVVTPAAGVTLATFKIRNYTLTDDPWWQHTGTVSPASVLTVDSGLYSADVDGTDAYDNITFGATQVMWIWMWAKRTNDFEIDVTFSGAAGNYQTDYYWWDTWVL